MLLGLDLGTTNIKATLFDRHGRVCGSGACPAEVLCQSGGRIEQDLAQIIEATVRAITRAVAEAPAESVEAIGVSSQGGALQPLDEAGEPLGPVIGWQDPRGQSQAEDLLNELGAEWFTTHTGFARPGLAVRQLVRLQEEGVAFGAIGFVGDQVVRYLTGRAAHDATSLSIAGLYNPATNTADGDLLDRLGLDVRQLPELLAADQPAGRLRDEVAERCGLGGGVPVGPAVHDQYAASLGVGAIQPGDIMLGLGTAWVLLLASDQSQAPAFSEAFYCRHLIDGLYGQMASMHNGGSALRWMLHILGLETLSGEQLDERLAAVPAGCDGLRCRPLLVPAGGARLGESVSGGFDGLSLSHTPDHLLRAVLEGLAFELGRYLRFFTQAGLECGRLILTGGAAESQITPQLLADVTGLAVTTHSLSGASVVGAGLLARHLADPSQSLTQLAGRQSPARTVVPGAHRSVYQPLLEAHIARVQGG